MAPSGPGPRRGSRGCPGDGSGSVCMLRSVVLPGPRATGSVGQGEERAGVGSPSRSRVSVVVLCPRQLILYDSKLTVVLDYTQAQGSTVIITTPGRASFQPRYCISPLSLSPRSAWIRLEGDGCSRPRSRLVNQHSLPVCVALLGTALIRSAFASLAAGCFNFTLPVPIVCNCSKWREIVLQVL